MMSSPLTSRRCGAHLPTHPVQTLGAWDPKGGGVDHGARVFDRETCTHRPEVVGGLMEAEAAALLTAFFRARR